MFTRRLLPAFGSAVLLVITGCRDAKIASYKVRRDAPPPAGAEPSDVATGVPQLHWKAPADWKEQPAGTVRIASFLVTADDRKADMSVTQFPGNVGGDLANVNRWRGQLQLAPIGDTELAGLVKPLQLPVGAFQLVDMTSEKPLLDGKYRARILGAWLKQGDRTWFFKLAGESELVNSQRAAFETFLSSLDFSAPAGAGPAEAAMAPGVPGMSAPAPITSGATKVSWTAPADWVSKPLGQMRKGSYTLKGASAGEADLSIISFPGEAGGVAENLNRWRGQVQLPPQAPPDLASSAHTLANAGLRFTVVDYVGTTANGPTRLVGAVLPLENETYFFKLIGPDAVVSQHKAAFMDFLKTVKTR